MKVVIIGGGLTGLSLVHWLHKNNHEAILLESAEKLGGRFRALEAGQEIGHIPPTEDSLAALEWLKSVSPTPFSWREEESQPLYFESSQWRPFLGFGDFPSSVVDELSYLTQSKYWQVDPGFEQITRGLIEQLPISARRLAEVTALECAEGQVKAAIVNGQEKVTGDVFVFCPAPSLLNTLLPGDALKPAHRSRLAKQPAWTVATLTLLNRQPVEASSALRFVLGSGREYEPIVGQALGSLSIWTIPIHSDHDGNMEHIGDCIRHIKRTLKRVWPELLDGLLEEKIRVRPQTYGRLDLRLKEEMAFPELSNLMLADARLSGLHGPVSTAAMAQKLSRLFVAGPQPSVLSDSETV